MFGSIVEITQEGRHIAVHKGLLVIKDGSNECGRAPLDTVEAVILTARQTTLSRPVMAALAQHNVLIVVCDNKFMPVSITAPYAVHFEAGKRMRAQAKAAAPLRKRIWKNIIQEKLRNQAQVLRYHQRQCPTVGKIELLAKAVRSGDTTNKEGQSARLYWRSLIGPSFIRDPEREDCNILFNYAYTVLRTAVARSLLGAGLHPALSVYHSHRLNAFALADDAMEPLRPLADHLVLLTMRSTPSQNLSPEVKRSLAALLTQEVLIEKTTTPLYQALHHMAQSLAQTYLGGKICIKFPQLMLPEVTY
jgi:CRISPR-associated protein Cas1